MTEQDVERDELDMWQQGYLLQTPQTLRWSKEEQKAADNEERRMVFKNFSPLDAGRSRQLIAQCQTHGQAESLVEEHNHAVKAALSNKHEKALGVASETLKLCLMAITGEGNVTHSSCADSTLIFSDLPSRIRESISTIDEIVGEK